MIDESILKGKFSNIFIKLLVGIMSSDLTKVKHFLSDEVYNRYQGVINQNIKNNEIQCYDELNVKELSIVGYDSDDKYDIVRVNLTSRYMDYVIDKDTLKYKRGVNDHRIEVNHILVFKKLKTANGNPMVVKCPGCGANLDVNNTGLCPYCGSIHSAESYGYVLYEVTNL